MANNDNRYPINWSINHMIIINIITYLIFEILMIKGLALKIIEKLIGNYLIGIDY